MRHRLVELARHDLWGLKFCRKLCKEAYCSTGDDGGSPSSLAVALKDHGPACPKTAARHLVGLLFFDSTQPLVAV
jgi:hypothetical protein